MTMLGSPRRAGRPAERAAPVGLPRLLLPPAAGATAWLPEHLARHGPAPRGGRDRLVSLLDAAGLAGRGGAGFPTARKLAAVAAGRRRPVVIANGTEGEPASAKDRTLLRTAPHLVLDGAALVADALGAVDVVVVVHADAVEVVEAAARERLQAGVDALAPRVVPAARGFVSGEETAVVHWVQRGDARPTATPPRPFERGLDGRPTLVQNVETLAHVALAARHGAGWFRSVGSPEEPGSMLVTVLGAVSSAGVREVPIGARVADVLEAAGGPVGPLRALLVGGYFGVFVPSAQALGAPLSRRGLAPLGASPGAGLLVALPAGACGLDEAARLLAYLAAQSAGQCGPCVFGLPAIAEQMALLATPGWAAGVDRARLDRWMRQVTGRGGCRHPDGAARLAASALTTFAGEVALHEQGRCTAVGR